jgi:hypothetical protein
LCNQARIEPVLPGNNNTQQNTYMKLIKELNDEKALRQELRFEKRMERGARPISRLRERIRSKTYYTDEKGYFPGMGIYTRF